MANSRSSGNRRTSAPSPSVAAGETAQPSAVGESTATSTPRAGAEESPRTRRGAAGAKSSSRNSGNAPRQGTAERAPGAAPSSATVSEETRRAMIAEAAYLRALRRGFGAGREEEDWLAAEKEVDALLSAGQGGPQ